MAAQTILMCPPDYFNVSYVINPWMEGHCGDTDRSLAHMQWTNLRDMITKHAQVVLQPPQKGLPDIVFTANAGLVLGQKAITSRFRNRERQGEESFDAAWFSENGFEILDWPQTIAFEGAGDALFDRNLDLLWVGQGFRSDIKAPQELERLLKRKTAVLHLIDPRFYHLDTCFCPLEGGYVLYYPEAFDESSRALIEGLIPASKRLPVSEDDALKFCCNAVELEKHVMMNAASEDLLTRLQKLGFSPVITPLSEFMKAGGAAKCLTLKLVET